MLSLMERFLNIPALTENALDELQEALGNENNELKEEMQQAKDNDDRHDDEKTHMRSCYPKLLSEEFILKHTVYHKIDVVSTG